MISLGHTVACNFLHLWTSTYQVSLCLYKNVVNEIKPSQLKNCLVHCTCSSGYGKHHWMPWKKCKMIIKIILFIVNKNSQKLVLRQAKTFLRDHKPSLTLLLQQVVKVYMYQNLRSPPWVCTEREYWQQDTLYISLPFLSQETLLVSLA